MKLMRQESTPALKKYRGQSFRWILEYALGYVGWFVDTICNETVTNSTISQNKAALKKYVESCKMVMENALGYVGWFVKSICMDQLCYKYKESC